jgi:mRNA interferase MazF
VRRGEIWWAQVDKRRPVVLVSRDEAYAVRALVIAAGVTTTVRGYAVEVKVGRSEGLPRGGVVNCDWLVTLPKSDLRERAGSLGADKLRQLDVALRFSLGLDNGDHRPRRGGA